MKETWKIITDYADSRYSISSQGKVRNNKTFKILSPTIDKYGYYRVTLWNGVKRISCIVHRLIAIYFIDNPKNKATVNHKNGIKTDNRLSNLEWATTHENITHAWQNNLIQSRPGIKHHNCKLSELDVIEIKRLVKQKVKRKIIAKMFNINKNHIYRIISGDRWKCLKGELNV